VFTANRSPAVERHGFDSRPQYEVLIVRQSSLNSSAMSFDEGKEKDLDSIWRTQDGHSVDYWIDFFTVSGVSPRSAKSSLESRLAAQDVMADAIFSDLKQVQ
jgi:hypothetical protein